MVRFLIVLALMVCSQAAFAAELPASFVGKQISNAEAATITAKGCCSQPWRPIVMRPIIVVSPGCYISPVNAKPFNLCASINNYVSLVEYGPGNSGMTSQTQSTQLSVGASGLYSGGVNLSMSATGISLSIR